MNQKEALSGKFSKYNISIPDKGSYFLYNTASGACIQLEENVFKALNAAFEKIGSSKNITDEYWKIAKLLMDFGFIVSEECDEFKNVIVEFDSRNDALTDLKLLLTPSLCCNMNCYYCFEEIKSNKSYDEKDMCAIAEFVEKRLPKKGNLEVTWFGGEPLLKKEIIYKLSEQFMEICHKKDARYNAIMVSNCYFLDHKTAKALKKNGVNAIQVTLDGDRKKHDRIKRNIDPVTLSQNDTFNRIIENLKHASEILDISVRLNVSKTNANDMLAVIDTLKLEGLDQKLKSLWFAPIFNYRNSNPEPDYKAQKNIHFNEDEFAGVEEVLIKKAFELGFKLQSPIINKKKGCQAIYKNGFVIDSTGELKKCEHLIGAAETSFSNIHHTNIIKSQNLNKWDHYKIAEFEECTMCKFFPLCYSGCPHKVMQTKKQQCISLKYNWGKTLKYHLSQYYSQNK
jgi:uncharacterized protein